LIWQFDLAIEFGNSGKTIWHFVLAIRFGNLIWQFNFSIWQFDLAIRLGAPEFWQELWAGKQLWMQQLWWCARNLML
jgi:hypothetical protein